jgi:hypothetical protein
MILVPFNTPKSIRDLDARLELAFHYAMPLSKSDASRPFPPMYGPEEILYPDHPDKK